MTKTRFPMAFSFLCEVLSPWTTEAEIDRLRECIKGGRAAWESVASYANRANLAPALYRGLVSKGLWDLAPAKLRELLTEVHGFNAKRNESLREQLLEAVGLLNDAGMVPLLLKGSAALAMNLFTDPAVRFMWDLDLLIPDGRLKRAVAVLQDGGYSVPEKHSVRVSTAEAVYRAHHYPPLVRAGAGAHIELHRRVLPDRCGPLLETTAVWEECARFESILLPGVSLALMSPTHQLIHCFAHSELAHRNHRIVRLDLRQLHNFAHLCHRFRDEVDWRRLASLRRETPAGHALGAYMHLAEELFGIETPISTRPDAYSERHLSRVAFFLDGKWKRLRVLREIIEQAVGSISEERMKVIYPPEDARSGSGRRLHRIAVLIARYSRLAAWKVLTRAMAAKYEAIG